MEAVRGGDELCRNPHPVPGLTHAPFESSCDAQLAADVGELDVLPLKGERRGAPRDVQPLDLCERVEDLLCNPVREIFLISSGAHIREWQHRD